MWAGVAIQALEYDKSPISSENEEGKEEEKEEQIQEEKEEEI